MIFKTGEEKVYTREREKKMYVWCAGTYLENNSSRNTNKIGRFFQSNSSTYHVLDRSFYEELWILKGLCDQFSVDPNLIVLRT